MLDVQLCSHQVSFIPQKRFPQFNAYAFDFLVCSTLVETDGIQHCESATAALLSHDL